MIPAWTTSNALRETRLPASSASVSRPGKIATRGWLGLIVCVLAIGSLCLPTLADEPRKVLVGTVTRVIDGDTIDVQLASGPIRVRFSGVDTPERGQPWEEEATAALSKMVLSKQVDLVPFEQDRYDRLIANVFLGDLDVNAELVKQGHGWAYRRYLTKDNAELCTLEYEARTAKRGLWSLPKDQRTAPWEWRRRKKRHAFTDYSRETAAGCVATIGR